MENSSDFIKKCIADALFILLKKRDFSAVTVKDLAAKAGIGRVTFYRKFSSKEDVVLYYFDTQKRLYLKETERTERTMENYRPLFEKIFGLIKQNGDKLLLLKKSRVSYLWLDYLNECFDKLFREKFHVENGYLHYARAGALYNLSMRWLEGGCKESAAEMADFYYGLLFLSPFAKA